MECLTTKYSNDTKVNEICNLHVRKQNQSIIPSSETSDEDEVPLKSSNASIMEFE